jgi:hypothetical protein
LSRNYISKAKEVGELVTKKQIQYGDSFGNAHHVLKVLYPDGVKPEQYKDFLTVTRVIDKLFRIANGDQGGESAWSDICGYSLLAITPEEESKKFKVSDLKAQIKIVCNNDDECSLDKACEREIIRMVDNHIRKQVAFHDHKDYSLGN